VLGTLRPLSVQASCPPDIDGNGVVNVDDLLLVLLTWGTDDPLGDINGDDTVDVNDMLAVILGYGACPGVTYQSLGEGSGALVSSTDGEQPEPAYGFIGVAESGSDATNAGDVIELEELSLDVPVSAPMGGMHIELLHPAPLLVQPEGVAVGELPLQVFLPMHDVTYDVMATGFLYDQGGVHAVFQLAFGFEPAVAGLDPFIFVDLAGMLREAVRCARILELIEELDDNDWQTRENAMMELIRIGKPALKKMQAALGAPGTSVEQRWRLNEAIGQINGVTAEEPEWIGTDDLGVYIFRYKVHVKNTGEAWTNSVCDLHFIVGTPAQTPDIDHAQSTITHNLPDGWDGEYDANTGEYKFEFSSVFDQPCRPLTPCTEYEITIRTPSIFKDDPEKMAWYYTNSDHQKIGDSGVTTGPVF
jgi:hypothetical protein